MTKHFFQNYRALATTSERKAALDILEAGLRAIDTQTALNRSVQRKGDILTVGKKTYDLKKFHRVFVIGIGKASLEAAKGLESILGNRISDGIVLDVKKGSLKHIRSFVGTHPLPTNVNTKITGEIIGLLKSVDEHDLVISIISGGGSALLCKPHELDCKDVARMTSVLMKKGATIQEMNTIRKHTSEIQGGQFARLAYPAKVIGLIFSDVPGDDLTMVASGPTCLDTTTVSDARRVLKKYDVLKSCEMNACHLIETPKDPGLFDHVYNVQVVGNQVALNAMKEMARTLGYRPVVYSSQLTGEAKEQGKMFGLLTKKGQVVIAAGETPVCVKGKGKGGRNQEFALGALESLPDDVLVVSCASDGIDHCEVAGGLVDKWVKEKIKKQKLNPKTFLDTNNSFAFFQKVGSFLKTGPTGMNVSDVMLALRKK